MSFENVFIVGLLIAIFFLIMFRYQLAHWIIMIKHPPAKAPLFRTIDWDLESFRQVILDRDYPFNHKANIFIRYVTPEIFDKVLTIDYTFTQELKLHALSLAATWKNQGESWFCIPGPPPAMEQQKMFQRWAEILQIESIISHPSGMHIELFSLLYVRPCEDRGKIIYEVGLDREIKRKVQTFTDPYQAAKTFVEWRHEYELGMDIESELHAKNETSRSDL
jgi:hypothetical protein